MGIRHQAEMKTCKHLNFENTFGQFSYIWLAADKLLFWASGFRSFQLFSPAILISGHTICQWLMTLETQSAVVHEGTFITIMHVPYP
jgi:hypothetical protein